MSKIIKCKNCGADVDSSAEKCLKCGVVNKKPSLRKYILGVIGVLAVLIFFIAVTKFNGSKNEKVDTNKEAVSASTENTEKTDTTAPTNATESTTSEKDSKKQDTKMTYENFLNIKMGQSYDDVVAVFGKGEESSSNEADGIKTTIYEWKESGVSDINITIENNVVTSKAQLGLKSVDAKITMDKYNQVQDGISYDELKAIVGEGQILSQSKADDVESIIYEYVNQNESTADFIFSEGKLIEKSQFNLE